MSILRTITDAFKSEFGGKSRRNPWPLCAACYRRVDPVELCIGCRSHMEPCCDKCDTCGRCVLRCPGHREVAE